MSCLSLAVLMTGWWFTLNNQCPMMVDGPSSTITQAIHDISTLTSSMDLYRLNHGRYPASWEEHNGFFETSRTRRDPYRREYVYRALEAGAGFTIYSRGPNGIDEFGEGDDLIDGDKKYDCPEFYDCPTVCERANKTVLVAGAGFWTLTLAFFAYLAVGVLARKVRRLTSRWNEHPR